MALDISKLITDSRQTFLATSTSRRFSFDIPEKQVYGLLEGHYRAMVEERHMAFVNDEATNKHLQKIAKWLTNEELKASLLLFGSVGNGKTTMAHAIEKTYNSVKSSIATYAAVAQREYLKSIEHLRIEDYWTYVGLFSQKSPEVKDAEEAMKRLPSGVLITSAQNLASLANDKDSLDKMKRHPFLIIDDFGCEPSEVKVYGTAVTPVVDVIYYRYDNILPTVITTNLNKSGIKETYGLRVADRLEEMCDAVAFTNNTYRR